MPTSLMLDKAHHSHHRRAAGRGVTSTKPGLTTTRFSGESRPWLRTPIPHPRPRRENPPAAASCPRSPGAAFAGTALVIAAPSAAQPDPSYCRDAWEVAALVAFRDLNPHQQEAALAFLNGWTNRVRELSADAIVDHPDATLMAACKRFAHLEREYGRLCQLTDWPMEHELTPAEQALQNKFDAVSDEQEELGAWLAEQVPQTDAGRQAKARAIIAYGGQSTADMISRLTLSLLQDLAGKRVA